MMNSTNSQNEPLLEHNRTKNRTSISSSKQQSDHKQEPKNCCCCVETVLIQDYVDFATIDQLNEIDLLREQSSRTIDPDSLGFFYENCFPCLDWILLLYTLVDKELIKRLWSLAFPALPYEGRVNRKWRDIGFQSDDPFTDFRATGRFGLEMLLYYAEFCNEDFKRVVGQNEFPFCACVINVVELLLIHLRLHKQLQQSSICPCCGPDFFVLEKRNPYRQRPELITFAALLTDENRSNSQVHHIHAAFCEVFLRTVNLTEEKWHRRVEKFPQTNLLQFRRAFQLAWIDMKTLLSISPRLRLTSIRSAEVPESFFDKYCSCFYTSNHW